MRKMKKSNQKQVKAQKYRKKRKNPVQKFEFLSKKQQTEIETICKIQISTERIKKNQNSLTINQ